MSSRPPGNGAEPGRHGLPALPPELDPRGKHRGASSAATGSTGRPEVRRRVRLGVQVVAAMLSVVLLAGFAYGWWNYRKLNSNLQRLTVTVGAAGTGSGGTSHDIDGKDQNILIAGNDDRTDMTNAEVKQLHTGRDGGSLATDTMMIVHIPANGAKATLISLPRDSYVSIPGHGMNRLNAAYADAYSNSSGSTNAKRAAGADLLLKTVTNLTGLTIDHFVQVDLIGFYRISEAIGGVTVNLCKAVDDTVAANKAEGSDGGSGLVLSAGKHVIKGVQALEFVRQRHNLPNGDLDRVARQRYFLTAAFRKIETAGTLLNPGKLNDLISAVDKSIYVDKGFSITTLINQLGNLSANNIVGQSIPTTVDNNSPVGDVLAVDPTKVKAFIAKLIGNATSALTKAKTVSPSTVAVSVINGGTVNGAAATNVATLVKDGFHASVNSKSMSSSATVIEYAKGMESQAKTLAAYVPGATYQKVSSISQVTLVLGADGLSAKVVKVGTTPSSPSSSPKTKALDSGCIN